MRFLGCAVPPDGNPYLQECGSNFWKCLLCGTGEMHTNVLPHHLTGYSRSYREMVASVEMCKKIAWIDDHLRDRINNLKLDRWKWHMDHLCLEHIYDDSTTRLDSPSVLSKLRMFEKKEKLSLLELTIWKAQCILSFAEWTLTEVYSVSMQDIEDYWTLDQSFDPIKYRQECRCKSGIEVCVESILAFLGDDF